MLFIYLPKLLNIPSFPFFIFVIIQNVLLFISSLIIEDVGMGISWYRFGLCDWTWLKSMTIQHTSQFFFIIVIIQNALLFIPPLTIQDVGVGVYRDIDMDCDWTWLKYMAQSSAKDGLVTNSDHYKTDYVWEIYSNTNDSHSFLIISLLSAALYTMLF